MSVLHVELNVVVINKEDDSSGETRPTDWVHRLRGVSLTLRGYFIGTIKRAKIILLSNLNLIVAS